MKTMNPLNIIFISLLQWVSDWKTAHPYYATMLRDGTIAAVLAASLFFFCPVGFLNPALLSAMLLGGEFFFKMNQDLMRDLAFVRRGGSVAKLIFATRVEFIIAWILQAAAILTFAVGGSVLYCHLLSCVILGMLALLFYDLLLLWWKLKKVSKLPECSEEQCRQRRETGMYWGS